MATFEKKRKYSLAYRQHVFELLTRNKSVREVSRMTGLSVSTVNYLKSEAQALALRKNLHDPNPNQTFRNEVIRLKLENYSHAKISRVLSLPLPWVDAWVAELPEHVTRPGKKARRKAAVKI